MSELQIIDTCHVYVLSFGVNIGIPSYKHMTSLQRMVDITWH